MDQRDLDALYRRLPAEAVEDSASGSREEMHVQFTNQLPVTIQVAKVLGDGRIKIYTTIKPSKTGPSTSKGQKTHDGSEWVFFTAWTGSYIGRLTMSKKHPVDGAGIAQYDVDARLLHKPNDIGPPPDPDQPDPDGPAGDGQNSGILIPPDSPRVLVGIGTIPPGVVSYEDKGEVSNVLLREQFWRRQPDSYAIAPGEHKTVSLTTTRGKQSTSSNSDTMAKSVGLSTGAGWGPVSASISASLSSSSTTTQQVTITEETTVYESTTFTNTDPRQQTEVFLLWQLVDVKTSFDGAGEAQAVVSQGAAPIWIKGPYDDTGKIIEPS